MRGACQQRSVVVARVATGDSQGKRAASDVRGGVAMAVPGGLEHLTTLWAAARLGGGRPAATGALRIGRGSQRPRVVYTIRPTRAVKPTI